MEFAERAIELDPQDPAGYQVLAKVMSLKGEYDQAVALVEKAFSIAPGDFQAAAELAFQLVWARDFERAMVYFARAKRLSPKYPAWIDWMMGLAQLMAGRPEDAIVSLQIGVDRAPNSFLARGRLVAGYAALDRLDEAKAEAAELLQIDPDMTASKFVDIHPFKDPVHRELFDELLLKVGLPEGKSSYTNQPINWSTSASCWDAVTWSNPTATANARRALSSTEIRTIQIQHSSRHSHHGTKQLARMRPFFPGDDAALLDLVDGLGRARQTVVASCPQTWPLFRPCRVRDLYRALAAQFRRKESKRKHPDFAVTLPMPANIDGHVNAPLK